ncbi:MAG: hypothetical protein ACI9B8_000849, partial [Sulfitobacter sp.]
MNFRPTSGVAMEPLEIFKDQIMLDKTVLVTGGGRGIG